MIGELIAIGDELITGRILNTTSSFAARQLFAAGHEIYAISTIGDDPGLIGESLKRAVGRTDFVIVTGGLGATSDDLTNEAASSALNRPATFYPEIFAKIVAHLQGRPLPDQKYLEKLAWLPNGSKALNTAGKMAGHLLIHDGKPLFFLPGVPHEMKELLVNLVLPQLAVWESEVPPRVRQKVYKIFGLPEIEINRRLEHLGKDDRHLRLGYYPVFPEVHLSLTCLGDDHREVAARFAEIGAEVELILGDFIFGTDDDTLESVVGRLLAERHQTLAVAESCTGGLVAQRITRVAGSSAYFIGGIVAYHNDLKAELLGVAGGLLEKHGAVSAAVARAMAEGVRRQTGVDIAVAVTGIAGPGGGSVAKPVGTVFLGLTTAAGTSDRCYNFIGNRWQIQELAAQAALDLVRRAMLKLPLKY